MTKKVDHLAKTILTVLFTVGVLLISTHAKADAAAAEATFKAKCAACHGTDGKGKEALKTQDLASLLSRT